ncbi:hypothetical protein MMC07_004837 [Pseudocyphellaria aurata]|nr:hypothetical protein [Pseudocyphellaria aurata]
MSRPRESGSPLACPDVSGRRRIDSRGVEGRADNQTIRVGGGLVGNGVVAGIEGTDFSPRPGDLDKTATLSLPPARDYFPRHYTAPARPTSPSPFEPTTPSSAFKFRLPSLDFSSNQVAQAGQYWPGAAASSTAGTIPPSNTLPTPPTADTDVFKPPGPGRDGQYSVEAGGVQPSGMTANLEPSGTGSSLTARRSATSNLPNFELPPPPKLVQKYHAYTNGNSNTMNGQPAAAAVSVGNLLTPPTNIPGDSLSPISSGVNSVSPAGAGVTSYTSSSYWPPHSGTAPIPYSFSTGTGTPQAWQAPLNPLFSGNARGLFSPSLGSLVRGSSSPATEGLPPPPYDLNQLPPFPGSTPMSMSTPANLPAISNQQALAQTYMNVQSAVPASTAQTSPVNAPDSYLQRPPPTPSYYAGSQPSSTPQQTNFPTFATASPVQQSPIGVAPPGSRMSNGAQAPGMQPATLQQSNQYGRPYPSYSLPTINGSGMTGPIMSNVHSPGGQMAMIGTMSHHGLPGGISSGMMAGFNSGHSAQMHQMYGPQQTPHNERPFKCDQCPQSFNRNHDLKRHKRIHLAVKPFPCGHCEKSFSRKDALKRHILVKGCGKNQSALATSKDQDSLSPVDKSEVTSSDNDDSPTMANSI